MKREFFFQENLYLNLVFTIFLKTYLLEYATILHPLYLLHVAQV